MAHTKPVANSEAGRATSRRHGAGFGFCKGLMCKEVQVEQVCEPFADAQGTNLCEHLENETVGTPPLLHCIAITDECIFLKPGNIVLTKSIIARKTRISRRLCVPEALCQHNFGNAAILDGATPHCDTSKKWVDLQLLIFNDAVLIMVRYSFAANSERIVHHSLEPFPLTSIRANALTQWRGRRRSARGTPRYVAAASFSAESKFERLMAFLRLLCSPGHTFQSPYIWWNIASTVESSNTSLA